MRDQLRVQDDPQLRAVQRRHGPLRPEGQHHRIGHVTNIATRTDILLILIRHVSIYTSVGTSLTRRGQGR